MQGSNGILTYALPLEWELAHIKHSICRSYCAKSRSDLGRTGNLKSLSGIHVQLCQVCFSLVGQREQGLQGSSPLSLGDDGGRRCGRKDVEFSLLPTQRREEGANICQVSLLGPTSHASSLYAPNTLWVDEDIESPRGCD